MKLLLKPQLSSAQKTSTRREELWWDTHELSCSSRLTFTEIYFRKCLFIKDGSIKPLSSHVKLTRCICDVFSITLLFSTRARRHAEALLLFRAVQVLCFRTLRRQWNECTHTHTHAVREVRSSLCRLQSSLSLEELQTLGRPLKDKNYFL